MNETTTTIETKLSRLYKWAMLVIWCAGVLIITSPLVNTPSPWKWVWFAFLTIAVAAGAPNAIDAPADPLKNLKIKKNRVIHIHENLVILIRLVSLLVVWPSMLWAVYVAFLSRAN